MFSVSYQTPFNGKYRIRRLHLSAGLGVIPAGPTNKICLASGEFCAPAHLRHASIPPSSAKIGVCSFPSRTVRRKSIRGAFVGIPTAPISTVPCPAFAAAAASCFCCLLLLSASLSASIQATQANTSDARQGLNQIIDILSTPCDPIPPVSLHKKKRQN